jgi:GNAT superfamily N-acetyltransferase
VTRLPLAIGGDRRYGAYFVPSSCRTPNAVEAGVARPVVLTRTANEDDLPVLLALLGELRGSSGRAERAVNPMSTLDLAGRLRDVLDDPKFHVVVACADGSPAGMAVMRLAQPDPLSENQLVFVPHLVVARACRQHGVGHALIAAAVEYADALHVDHVAVSVYPSLRETNRFYARLGFAPAVMHRVAPVAVLRRRVATGRRPAVLGDVVRRRTRVIGRIPAHTAPLPAQERVET